MKVLVVSLAPVVIIASFIYLRDKYEREPISFLLLTLLVGALITYPILLIESALDKLVIGDSIGHIFYRAYFVASFFEEGFIFLTLFVLIWNNKNFDENFDGIVYAVFISLGFALIENIDYVIQGGLTVGMIRAITAVPMHAITGVIMGFYLGWAKFNKKNRTSNIIKSILFAVLFHGTYDFLLMSKMMILLAFWMPLIVYLWWDSFRKIRILSESSQFKDENKNTEL